MAKVIRKHGKIILVTALTLAFLVMYLIIPQTSADTIANREIKISDSRPDAAATSVIYDFEGNHSTDTVRCLEIAFCTTASGDCTQPTGFTAASATKYDTSPYQWNGWTTANWTIAAIATRVRYTYATGETGTANYSFATASITNPSAEGTYYARAATYSNEACSTGVDSGVTAFAIVYGVAVSATVPETLDFAISGITNANCDTIFGDFDGPDPTTASAVAFGELSSINTFYHACNDLTLSTNAGAGYSVTAHELTSLRDSTTSNLIEDSTGDSGSMDATTTSAWATADDNAGFGYACGNISGTDCVITSTSLYRQFACTGTATSLCSPNPSGTPVSVMTNNTAVSASQSRIEYKLTISGTQAAGSYSNTVVYIATPTY